MFISVPTFSSVNRTSDIAPGTYNQIASEFQNETGTVKAIYNEYFNEDTSLVACDLFIILESEEVLFSDFLRLSDGSWRDCNGEVAESLQQLLPKEIMELRSISKERQATFQVSNGNVATI